MERIEIKNKGKQKAIRR